MSGEKRKTGINIVGDVPWGTHLCQFYQTKEDLIDILVPYFKTGLENNEFCMWVTSEPLGVEEAKASLRKVVRNLDEYIKKGQIEILDHTEWYIKSGKFDADEVLQGWVEKERQALERGFDGLRLTGNTFWLERNDWKDFVDYEAKVDSVIGNYRMMAVCTYSLDKCGASEVIEVVKNHQFALIRRESKWELIESSERKQAEERLKESEERYRNLVELSPASIIASDMKGVITSCNPMATKITGYSEDEVIGKHFLKIGILNVSDIPRYVKLLTSAARGKVIKPVELQCYRKDGTPYWAEVSVTLMKRGSKRVGFLAISTDITERKQAEETLRESRDYLERLTNSMWDAVFEVKMPERVIEWANDSFKLIGYDLGECIGKTTEFLYPDESEFLDFGNKLKNVIAAGKDILHAEQLLKRKSGEVFPAEITATISKEKGEIVRVTSIVRDITKRKQVKEALRQSEEKLRLMFEALPEGITIIDIDGKIVQSNKATAYIYGYDNKEEIIGLSIFEFIAKKDRTRITEIMKKTLNEGPLGAIELTQLRKDRSEFPAEVSGNALKDASGNPIGFITITEDITERKQAEEKEKKLQQQIYLSSRLAAIGELAAGVAHEINNPLTGVLGFSQRLLRKSTDQEVSQGLEIIHSEALRAAKVVQNLLTFARRRESKKEYSDINEILGRTLELRTYELTMSNIEVITDLAPSLPRTIADFQQIEEVFLNIIMNAEQAMSETNGGGKLTIKTREITGNIRVSFTDNGPGIPAEHLDNVFDPFFTTKEEGSGTGLGLSICHGIVAEHGGRIYATSKPGKGATFFVELPVVTEEVDRSRIVEE